MSVGRTSHRLRNRDNGATDFAEGDFRGMFWVTVAVGEPSEPPAGESS